MYDSRMKQLTDDLFNLTGIPPSIHLYCSAAGAKVLKPHTDPYDVLVWQLVGAKRWRGINPIPRREEPFQGSIGMQRVYPIVVSPCVPHFNRIAISNC